MQKDTQTEAGLASHLTQELDTAKKNCNWFTSHKWGKWEEIGQGRLIQDGKRTVGFWIKQERVCLNCGLKQLRVDGV